MEQLEKEKKEGLFVKASELFRLVADIIRFPEVLDDTDIPSLIKRTDELLEIKPKNQPDMYTHLCLRQLSVFLRLIERDRHAPVTALLLHSLYIQLGDALRERRNPRDIAEYFLEILSKIPTNSPEWCLYEPTVTIINQIVDIFPSFESSRPLKRLVDFLNSWVQTTPCILPLTLHPEDLCYGYGIDRPPTNFVSDLLSLHKHISYYIPKIKEKVHTVNPGELTADELLQYFSTLLQLLHELSAKNLPIADMVLNLKVVTEGDAKITDALGYFMREGNRRSVVLFFPPTVHDVPLPEYAHLIIHEGIPGHATCDYLLSQMTTLSPLDYAISLETALPLSFVDVSSLFHEGWAVFSQYYASTILKDSFPSLYYWWFRELHLYVQRVLQVLGYFKRSEREYIRSIRPFQLTSYMFGFVFFWSAYKRSPKIPLNFVTTGALPIPTDPEHLSEEFFKALRELRDETVGALKSL